MVLTRALNKLICRVLIGVFLFAQLAVAAYACPGLGQPTQRAAVMQLNDAAGAMPGDCDESMDQDAANLCAEHCKFGQQSSDTAAVPVVWVPVPALLYVLPTEDVADLRAGSSVPAPDPHLAVAPPPHAILHCVLRI